MLHIREDVNKLIVLFILILHWLTAGVLATHFRGGIIMVRPVDGGAPAEVNYKQSSYNYRLKLAICLNSIVHDYLRCALECEGTRDEPRAKAQLAS